MPEDSDRPPELVRDEQVELSRSSQMTELEASSPSERETQNEAGWTQPTTRGIPLESLATELGETGVEVGRTLARGGMAVVHLGRQRKLDRAVAVKTLRDGQPEDFLRLLREAQLTSRLEHPNIVPVHDIFTDDDGTPQVVLKLIEGDTWATLMFEPEQAKERFGADDLLEWNLDVLMSVCQATSFAHSHGVIHRDIKPRNIMVGAFGEVYLLDWGIAHEMEESTTELGALPADAVAGTLGYMAPEQLEGDGSLLGPWTDTYLLGATLFHVLVGHAPHAGKSRVARYRDLADRAPAPELPDHVPAELRRVIRRALDPDPSKRPADTEAFRRSLSDFLRHRAANRLVERGEEERALAEAAWEGGNESETLRYLLAAEVAYRTALQEWPGCTDADDGTASLLVLRVEHALATGEPKLAARLLEGHAEVSDSLRVRVEVAVAEALEEEARLRQIASDADRGIGHRARGILGAIFGALFMVWWTWVAFVPPETVWPLVTATVVFGLLGTTAVATQAAAMMKTRLNRMMLTILGVTIIVMVCWFIGGAQLGFDVRQIQTVLLLLWALAAVGVAVTVHVLGLPTAGGFAVAFLVASHEPSWMPYAMVSASLVMLANHVALNLFVTGPRATGADVGADPESAGTGGSA